MHSKRTSFNRRQFFARSAVAGRAARSAADSSMLSSRDPRCRRAAGRAGAATARCGPPAMTSHCPWGSITA